MIFLRLQDVGGDSINDPTHQLLDPRLGDASHTHCETQTDSGKVEIRLSLQAVGADVIAKVVDAGMIHAQ